MSGFTQFKRGECPICDGASKGCRESKLTNLIFCRDTSANPSGYHYRGEDRHGFGLWQSSDDAQSFSEEAREERDRRRREFLAAEERRRERQIALQLPATERDKWYTELLQRLTLSADDKQKLLERGFTEEQIIRDGYRSVSQWQKVGRDFPSNLPGVLGNGALNVSGDGILCPIRNHQGLIVGCQVRLHESTDGRYRWLTSSTQKNPDGASPHLDGELPLGVFEPEQFSGNSIWLTEGTTIKPSLTRDKLSVPVVGAASGRFNTSPEATTAAVEYLADKYQTKMLTFAIDAGDVLNKNVLSRWKEQFNFFTSLGYSCRVAWWDQVTKDSDDIDELSDLSAITYITPEEFWSIVEEHRSGNQKPQVERKRSTMRVWRQQPLYEGDAGRKPNFAVRVNDCNLCRYDWVLYQGRPAIVKEINPEREDSILLEIPSTTVTPQPEWVLLSSDYITEVIQGWRKNRIGDISLSLQKIIQQWEEKLQNPLIKREFPVLVPESIEFVRLSPSMAEKEDLKIFSVGECSWHDYEPFEIRSSAAWVIIDPHDPASPYYRKFGYICKKNDVYGKNTYEVKLDSEEILSFSRSEAHTRLAIYRDARWDTISNDDGTLGSNLTLFPPVPQYEGTGSPRHFILEEWDEAEANNNLQELIETPNSIRWAWKQWLRSRKFTPTTTVNQQEFEFGAIPESNAVIGVNSGLGSRKTGAMIRQPIKESKNRAIIIGYRNNLLYQTIYRAEEEGVEIVHISDAHVDIKNGNFLLAQDDSINLALCLDSIHHIDGCFAGTDIYLDEACSVLLHAVNGGTLGDNQAKALKILTRAIEVCNRVFLLDGNLADIHVDFVAKLAPKKQVVKIKNQRKIAPHTIKFVDGIDLEGEIKKRDKSPLFKMMCDENVKPWIVSDSKELTKVIDEILKQFGKTGLVLNSETAGEDFAKQFLKNPDNYIQKSLPDYCIISPTAESGVSVTVKNYFTHKFTFFVGVLGTNNQHQQMFRERDDTIPHYVICPEKSIIRDRSNPRNYSVNSFKQILDDRIIQSALLAANDSDRFDTVMDVIGKALSRNNDDWWQLSCKLGALDNFEMDNLRKCLAHALTEAGHDVEITQLEVSEEFKAREKAAKEELQLKHSQELYIAVEYESIDAAKEAQKSNPRKETQRRIEKTYLLDRLPGIQNFELWNAEFIKDFYIKDKEYITKQQRFWLLNNFDVSRKRHEVDWFYKATSEDFFSASMKRISHLTIWALKELNIMGLVGKQFYKDSPEVVQIVDLARSNEAIKSALRIEPKPARADGKERLDFIRTLLDLIGLKMEFISRKLVDGVRQRIYEINAEAMQHPARLAVLECTERKFTKWMQEKSQVNWNDVFPQEQPANEETPSAVEVESAIADTNGLSHIATQEVSYQQSESSTDSEVTTEEVGYQQSEVVGLVDREIKQRSPLCDLSQLPLAPLWSKRLNRALLMGQEVARSLYSHLYQSSVERLNEVWQVLTPQVQQKYCELFI